MISLGCAKNLVDSEVMMACLQRQGFSFVADPLLADIVLINSCGFLQTAVEETVDEIIAISLIREEKPDLKLVVAGCMVQRYGKELPAELPEVDLFVSVNDFARIDKLILKMLQGEKVDLSVDEATYIMSSSDPRLVSTGPYSYLKISDGCNNRCAYCLIPSIRGQQRSRTIDDLLLEAGRLESEGVVELSLIGHDLTAYGADLVAGSGLSDLLTEIISATKIPWLRLLYLYPANVTDKLLALMAENSRVVSYLDIPFQHVSGDVLLKMNRNYNFSDLDELIGRIRQYMPDCVIRTTFMVGFPGEKDEDFNLLMESVARWQLDHVGVFRYQDEEGAVSCNYKDKVPLEVAERRYKQLMEAQAKISLKKKEQLVGRVEEVLLLGLSQESDLLLEGRLRSQAPEVDGCVYITDGQGNAGEIVSVRITEAHPYDLVGEIVRE